eukprot:GILJ01002995.1.p1 GENE.GILJ01002995.1~~GILJ01002995.1.p1  ORF type:complete len:807 (+),score=74.29 GILJ01002995.1:153-2573(+)
MFSQSSIHGNRLRRVGNYALAFAEKMPLLVERLWGAITAVWGALWDLVSKPFCLVSTYHDTQVRRLYSFGCFFIQCVQLALVQDFLLASVSLFGVWLAIYVILWMCYLATRTQYYRLGLYSYLIIASALPYIVGFSVKIGYIHSNWTVFLMAFIIFVLPAKAQLLFLGLHFVLLGVYYANNNIDFENFRILVLYTAFILILNWVTRLITLEALAEKHKLTSTVSHELRTPLNGMIATLELLLDSGIVGPQKELAGIALMSAENMLHLVEELLTFAKIQSSTLQVQTQSVDLRECMTCSLKPFLAQCAVKNVEMVLDVERTLPPVIKSDGFRLMQITSNFVSNALKYSPPNTTVTVRVSMKADSTDKAKDSILFEVRDQGSGLSPYQQKKLFQPFSQLDQAVPGTGLGLVISQSLARLLGGSCGVVSTPGNGSTFWFSIPLLVDDVIHIPVQSTHTDSISAPVKTFTAPAQLPSFRGVLTPHASPNSLSRSITTTSSSMPSFRSGLAMQYMTRKLSDGVSPTSPSPNSPSPRSPSLGSSSRSILSNHLAGVNESSEISIDIENGYATAVHPSADSRRENGQKVEDIQTEIVETVTSSAEEVVLVVPFQADSNVKSPVEEEPAVEPQYELTTYLSSNHIPTFGSLDRLIGGPAIAGTILIAEDNVFNQQVARMMLRSLGFQADVAKDGKECLHLYSSQPHNYAAILMDCQMPTMDGHQATIAIRELEKTRRWDPIPIVGLTADAALVNETRCLAEGMDQVLTKPVRRKDLHQALTKHLVNSNISIKPFSTSICIDPEVAVPSDVILTS